MPYIYPGYHGATQEAQLIVGLLNSWPLNTVDTDAEINGGDVVEWLGTLKADILKQSGVVYVDPDAKRVEISPEDSGIYCCLACNNREKFIGIDAHGYGGPSECDGSCKEREMEESTEEDPIELDDSFCGCETELEQRFTVPYDPATGTWSDAIDYESFTGGGYGAEIGHYSTIECGVCGFTVWAEDERIEV